MGVPTLGDTPPTLRRLQQRVAFRNRDSLIHVGKHPCGEKPAMPAPRTTAWSPIFGIFDLPAS
jgi:hypothetical protein